MPKVSICIAVYNVEKYIEQCVRSLFEQTLDDLEYVFVDDATPDASIDIMLRVLEDYPHRKEQVKLIRHETNQGVAATRKDAIAAATGDYIIHCDPDDWVELDMYETLYNKAIETDADMVYCRCYIENGCDVQISAGYAVENGDVLEAFLKEQHPVMLWDKLYKSHIVHCKNIKYFDFLRNAEDNVLTYQYLMKVSKISSVDDALYHYRKDNDFSLTKADTMISIIAAYNISSELFKNEKYLKILKNYKISLLLEAICIDGKEIDAKLWKKIWPEIKADMWRSSNYTIRLKMIFYVACINYQFARWLWRAAKKLKGR